MLVFKKILVPIDIAEAAVAEPAVVLASELAAMVDGAVRLIHVVPPIPRALWDLLPAGFAADREREARRRLDETAQRAGLVPVRVTSIVRKGRVDQEILTEASDWGADLLIIGSHSPSMGKYLLGSNAEKVVREATCSVLVARPHKNKEGAYWLVPPIAS